MSRRDPDATLAQRGVSARPGPPAPHGPSRRPRPRAPPLLRAPVPRAHRSGPRRSWDKNARLGFRYEKHRDEIAHPLSSSPRSTGWITPAGDALRERNSKVTRGFGENVTSVVLKYVGGVATVLLARLSRTIGRERRRRAVGSG